MTVAARTSTADPCDLHEDHSPVNLIVEYHHVIPQAWQHFWVPPSAKLDHDKLWDARTVPICPTGHRNVHVLIVAIMRALGAQTELGEGTVLVAKAIDTAKPRGHSTEFETAQLALSRFRAANGNLWSLVGAGEWGMS